MRYALAAVILAISSMPVSARQPSSEDRRQVSNTQVHDLCVEITGEQTGHPVRDCMASVDLFLARHDVPRAEP